MHVGQAEFNPKQSIHRIRDCVRAVHSRHDTSSRVFAWASGNDEDEDRGSSVSGRASCIRGDSDEHSTGSARPS